MEKLIVALSRLGYIIEADKKKSFNMSVFKNRLFCQKLIFLLNELSNELNYNYNWYIRGPYSPDLTKDLFYIDELWNQNRSFIDMINEKNAYNTTFDNAVSSINKLKSSFEKEFRREYDTEDLEILASLLFIDKHTFSKCRNSKTNTIKEFIERKPELKDQPISNYWDILKSSNFI